MIRDRIQTSIMQCSEQTCKPEHQRHVCSTQLLTCYMILIWCKSLNLSKLCFFCFIKSGENQIVSRVASCSAILQFSVYVLNCDAHICIRRKRTKYSKGARELTQGDGAHALHEETRANFYHCEVPWALPGVTLEHWARSILWALIYVAPILSCKTQIKWSDLKNKAKESTYKQSVSVPVVQLQYRWSFENIWIGEFVSPISP